MSLTEGVLGALARGEEHNDFVAQVRIYDGRCQLSFVNTVDTQVVRKNVITTLHDEEK